MERFHQSTETPTQLEKQSRIRRIAQHIQHNCTPIPSEWLDVFEIGEVVIGPGHAGGSTKWVVRGHQYNKYLSYETN